MPWRKRRAVSDGRKTNMGHRRNRAANSGAEPDCSPSPGLRTPMSHQSVALDWSADKDRVAFFMAMRLGKCLVAIRYMQSKGANRVLLLAPLQTIAGWLDELSMECVEHHYISGPVKSRHVAADHLTAGGGWAITNYEGVLPRKSGNVELPSQLLMLDWDGIVLDESTRIRKPTAKVTKAIVSSQTDHIKYRAILSGLPNPEDILDYYCQMAFVSENRTFMGASNWWQFRHKLGREFGPVWVPYPGSEKRVRRTVKRAAFVLTRKAAKVGGRKVYERLVAPLKPSLRRVYKQIERDFEYTGKDGQVVETKHVLAQLNWLSRIAGGFTPELEFKSDEKIKLVLDLMRGNLKGEQVIIWCKYTKELHAVYRALRGEFRVARLYGKTDVARRARIKSQFEKSKIQIIVGQIKCGRFGQDYSASDTAIYYSNRYDFEDRAQTEDRIVHPKKSSPLLYIDLVTENTIDEAVVKVLRKKRLKSGSFLDAVVHERFGGRK